ncbi:PD-(D/E)XK nuclease family protein [archaeon]|nr:PD-(D/E)XK nuclease family protein [archaeon]
MAIISRKKPIVGMDDVYKHFLDKIHYNPENYDEKRDKPVHRASMGGRCHRLQKYHTDFIEYNETLEDGTVEVKIKKKYKPKELDYETKKVFRIGDITHKELQQAFQWIIDANKDKNYYELRMEVEVSVVIHGLIIDGHYDNVLINHKTKQVSLYDIKTMKMTAFKFFKAKPMDKTGAIIQLGVYAKAIKEEFPDYDLTVILVGISKENSEMLEVVIDENSAIQDAYDYYKNLAHSMKLDINQLVPISNPFSPMEQWECNYCNYNHICPSPKITIK